ncbi:MAG TPA: phosphoglucosamine mutase [Pyrinomonadaceae bacterium]|nr:phosphoglucosamine mutase [Pyrinomonadaceae bacterium]
MKQLFGTDGIRGVAGEFPLDEHTVGVLGYSLVRRMREKLGREPRLVTGRDTRESGAWIEKAFHCGAKTAGCACESAGVITTPGVAAVTRLFDFDAGVVISASHNPFEDNGIKIFAPSGKKIEESAERLLESDIVEADKTRTFDDRSVDDSRAGEFVQAYTHHLTADFQDFNLANFKMVIDCANGAASAIAPELFRGLGASVMAINDKPDGRNINKNCGSMHLEQLCAAVIAEKADFGVAYDGDADRALFVDENGTVIDGDGTLWIMGKYLHDRHQLKNDAIVATVMSNIGLEIALASRDVKLLRTAVGDKYVLDELLKTGVSIGGEQSGHVIFPEKSLVGDGIVTTLFVLKAISDSGKRASENISGFSRYPQTLVNVRVREKQPFESVAPIAAASRQIEQELDGTGRLLLRYSGTENLARVMIEGKDQAEIEEKANRLADIIMANLG